MVCRRSDFEGQPAGEAQNPPGQTFTPQTEGNRVQGEAEKQGGHRVMKPQEAHGFTLLKKLKAHPYRTTF